MKPSERPEQWWGQDPSIVACPRCGCPIQDGPFGMSKHNETVHRTTKGAAS